MKTVFTVDIDEVLAEYVDTFLRWNWQVYGGPILDREDMDQYDMSDKMGLSRVEFYRRITQFEEQGRLRTLSPRPGAAEGIQDLLDLDFDVQFVTNRHPRNHLDTRRWINENMPYGTGQIWYAWKKPKGVVIDELGAAYHIDDSLKNCKSTHEWGAESFLLDCPWNRDKELEEGIIRVYNWSDVIKYVRDNRTVDPR